MFIGRERELAALNKLYKSDKFEFVVIYGRRRVGKTALISRFIEDKNAIYFMGIESNAKQNLENFSKSILSYHTGVDTETSFLSFQAALEYVFKLSEKERVVLAMDEYPYVARSSKSLASTIQLLIDQYKDASRLMLILCGSSMSYMEDHVLAYKAPLYGRRTAQMKILPFDFAETCRYFQNFTAEEKAYVYGIVGGTPQYLLQISDKLSIEDTVERCVEPPTPPCLRNRKICSSRRCGNRRSTMPSSQPLPPVPPACRKFPERWGENTNICSAYVKNLISLGIIEKETPYGEKGSRKAIYSIADNMFRFWYRFVPENNSIIARGAADLAYKRIEPHLSDYMGKVFEEICRQYLWKLLLSGECPVEFSSLGRWWGSDPRERRQEEIDILAEQDKNTALFGECKWTNEKVDLGVLETLVKRSELFPYKNVHYYLFAKTGFTRGCTDRAKEMGNVTLVKYADIVSDM